MDAQESTRSTTAKEAELALSESTSLMQFAFSGAAAVWPQGTETPAGGAREPSRAHFKATKALQNSAPALCNSFTLTKHSRISKDGILPEVLQETHLKNDDENRSLPGDVGKKC